MCLSGLTHTLHTLLLPPHTGLRESIYCDETILTAFVSLADFDFTDCFVLPINWEAAVTRDGDRHFYAVRSSSGLVKWVGLTHLNHDS